jgi:HD superfamily phosphodiesterase
MPSSSSSSSIEIDIQIATICAREDAAIGQRWNMLSEFVQTTCADRSETHGHAHMEAVAEMSAYIIQKDFAGRDNGDVMLDTITAAWLHDIADHKYDYDGTLEQRLDEFGTANISNYAAIKQVIKYVSYSTENKAILAGTPLDFKEILGDYYSEIRDIVSDADKLESIGEKGMERSLSYNKQTNPTYTDAQVIQEVRKIYDEKLIKLATFIRTPTARAIARKEEREMEDWLENYEDWLNENAPQ